MMPHDTIENRARMMRTAFWMGLASAMIARSEKPELPGTDSPCACCCRARKKLPSVRKRGLRGRAAAPLGQRQVRRTVSCWEMAVKPMLGLEFSPFHDAPLSQD